MERHAGDVASVMSEIFGPRLVGVYLHGSAVLGGFNPQRSDVDLLVVCQDPMTAEQRSAVAERLSADRLPLAHRNPRTGGTCSNRVLQPWPDRVRSRRSPSENSRSKALSVGSPYARAGSPAVSPGTRAQQSLSLR
ncbi:hypothetical protein GBF35_29280 [Nonomuraea phyllanthi]|nr:hypothetical protein GBF35_29280 [Nonomuraea phyllanthi]